MHRFLSLYLLIVCILCTFGLSYGLTYRSNHHCYAGVCGSWLFPTQARRHVAVWYSWLAISIAFLSARSFFPRVRKFTGMCSGVWIPLMGKRLTLGGLMLVMWQCCLYGILVGIWWPRLGEYFEERGKELPGNVLVAFVAQSGHLADVTTGLVLLPVTRHGALAAFFKLEHSTNFIFHMTEAYILFALILVHGLTYAGWVSLYNRAKDSFRYVYPVLNPTYYYCEVWPGNTSALGIWRASLIFSGIVSTAIMTAMFLTSFPVVRQKYFNVFYFTHLLGIVAIVVICLHASTMFYCTAPGLSMWLLDWGLRAMDLRKKLESRLTALGNGWYTLRVAVPRKRLASRGRKSPLAHFHIHHSASSKFEIHPFTTTTYLDSADLIERDGEEHLLVNFLFREMENKGGPERPLQPSAKKRKQWTTRLAALTDEENVIGSFPGTDSEKTLVKRNNDDSSNPSRIPSLRYEGGHVRWIGDSSGSSLEGSIDEGSDDHSHASRIPSVKYENNHVRWIGGRRHSGDSHDDDDEVSSSRGSTRMSSSSEIPSLQYSNGEVQWVRTPSSQRSRKTSIRGSLRSSVESIRSARDDEKEVVRRESDPTDFRITDSSVALKLRLEGPYFTAAKPMSYKTVVCLVAGTGVTGGIAIGDAFKAHRRTAQGLVQCPRCMEDPRSPIRWTRCVLVWVVREDDYVDVPAINALECEVRICKTAKGQARPDLQAMLQEYCGTKGNDCWAYVCGPPGFVASAERACTKIKGLTWCATT